MVVIGVQCRNGHRQVVGAECLENHCRCEAEVGISHPIGIYVVWYCNDCPGNTPADEVLVG